VLVYGGDPAVLAGLRACRVDSAPCPQGEPLAYARAWRYTHVVEITLTTATLVRVEDQERQALPRDSRALGAAAAALLERAGSSD
jgi:hypothetical protein